MKLRVQVDGEWFEVEIADLSARPVIAYVEGELFEVWPETSEGPAVQPAEIAPAQVAVPPPTARAKKPETATLGAAEQILKVVRAPIPGVIISIAVQPSAEIAVGDELCVLEAMKMRNSIRATRSGQIGKINVSPGQSVRHHEVLMEYSD